MISELPAEKLRRVCDPQLLGCDTSEEMEPLETIIGQERAVKSLQLGLGIKGRGFNIYVAGTSGTGKMTAVEHLLEGVARDKPVPSDWCYVHNFHEPYHPKALCLPPGRAKEFEADMRRLVDSAKLVIKGAFESDKYTASRAGIMKAFEQQKEALFSDAEAKAQQEGFLVQSTPMGFLGVPLKDGKPLEDEQFLALSAAERQEISQKRWEMQEELKTVINQVKSLEKTANEKLDRFDRQVALFALNHLIDDLNERYQDLPEAVAYLEEVQNDMLAHLSQFRNQPKNESAAVLLSLLEEQAFKRYEVDVLVDNTSLDGAPVVMELNPTYENLFGRVGKDARLGATVTDFTMIRAGALHRANGGYLILPIQEVLRNLFSWGSLKRALTNGEITIEEAGEKLGFVATKSLRPDPIALDVKVVLIGQPVFYHLLHALDEGFGELFKVKADFDTRMDRTDENVRHYAAFACALCKKEGLKHLDRSALVKVVEYGSRLVKDQDKLSAKFGEISDVIREASFYAEQEKTAYVTAAHLKKAIDERFYRSNLLQERIREVIERGTLMIDVEGEEVGQVNGLSIINLGDITFGRPNRITASIGLGREGLVDIEREAELGGPIHTKGVMILSGYLVEKFAQDKPLSLSAHLVFEQSYAGVDGDSGSSAELCAILSSLSGLPIRQGIAVAGSVDQKGRIQAIGGVNEKIEGFFDICQAKGLTGEQGVIVPESNVVNLMLREDIVDAVKEGKFHIWPVKTVDEGIELLTGVKAGDRNDNGDFEEGTVSYLVDKRLRQSAETIRAFARDGEINGYE